MFEDGKSEVEKGRLICVVRGRKVPLGTSGVCIWVGNGRWGARVGLKDSSGGVHWTAFDNVDVASGPVPPSKAVREERNDPAPKFEKGDRVEMTRGEFSGEFGTVFWAGTSKAGNPRIGVRFGKGRSAPSEFFPARWAKPVGCGPKDPPKKEKGPKKSRFSGEDRDESGSEWGPAPASSVERGRAAFASCTGSCHGS
jgi:hypothetical protein